MTRRYFNAVLTILLAVVCFTTLGGGTPDASSNNFETVAAADLIVVGLVTDVSDIKRSTMTIPGGAEVECRIMRAHVRVDRVLKGTTSGPVVTVQFNQPLRESFGYKGLNPASYRLIFLTKAPNDESLYQFTNPFYSSLPALPQSAPPGQTFEATVISETASVIASPAASWEVRREAIFSLYSLPDETITSALKAALSDADPRVSNSAAAFLLLRNDISGLPLAEQLLSGKGHTALRQDDRSNLLAGITYGIHSNLAVEPLEHLLKSQDPEIRAAAAAGLGNTGSELTKPSLLKGLDDSDLRVRFAASNALANLTGETQWRQLSRTEFAKEEQKYLLHWKSSAR